MAKDANTTNRLDKICIYSHAKLYFKNEKKIIEEMCYCAIQDTTDFDVKMSLICGKQDYLRK